jgi:hypothetical protein
MMTLFSGKICGNHRNATYAAIRHNDPEEFERITAQMQDELHEQKNEELDKKAKNVGNQVRYVLNNWEAIQAMLKHPDSIGSCTEPLVSHVLSKRLSRNPMGWSPAGLQKMTGLRVYAVNGGTVTKEQIAVDKRELNKRKVIPVVATYERLVEEQKEEIFGDIAGCEWFKKKSMISGQRTGTRVIINGIGKMRNIG